MNELELQAKIREIKESSARQIAEIERMIIERKIIYSNFCDYLKSKSELYRKMIDASMIDDMLELHSAGENRIDELHVLHKKSSSKGLNTYFLELEIECFGEAMEGISNLIDDRD